MVHIIRNRFLLKQIAFTFNTYTENNKLYVSTRYSYLAYSDSIFGYEIIFPKFSQSDVDYYGLASERELNAYPDYELFRKKLLKSHPHSVSD